LEVKFVEEELINELLELPKLIKEKQYDILQLQKQLRFVQYRKREIEDKITLDVVGEKDKWNKPKFSNVDARRAEISRRLRENREFQEIAEYERELLEMINKEKIELEYLRNRFSGIKHYMRYISSLGDEL